MWAITPRGVGEPVAARRVRPGWPLAAGETFTVDAWSPDMVLAEDEASLRAPTAGELEAREQAERRAGVNAERDRRIRLGFLYDFGSEIGERRLDCRHGRDEINWTHVRESVAALVADGQGSTTIDLRCAIDETLSVPASDLADAFAAMSAWRSAVYAASWALKDMPGGIPADYDDDGYWP